MSRLEKVRNFITENNLINTQTFKKSNIMGDRMVFLYEEDGILICRCCDYDYLEIFGLTDEEYESLNDILNIE